MDFVTILNVVCGVALGYLCFLCCEETYNNMNDKK